VQRVRRHGRRDAPCADADRDGGLVHITGADLDTHSDAHSDTEALGVRYGDAHPDAHTDSEAHGVRYGDTYTDTDTDRDSDADADTDSDAETHRDSGGADDHGICAADGVFRPDRHHRRA
jgi:surface protein G